MFRRLSNSLMSPKEVAKYHSEPVWKTLVFFIILLLFIMIPFVLMVSTGPLLTGSTEKTIKKAFVNEDIPFVIEDGKLRNINNEHDYVYQNPYFYDFKVAFTEDEANYKDKVNDGLSNPLQTTYVIFCGEGIAISNPLVGKMRFSYNDFKYLKNLDFSNKENLKSLEFWDNIFYIANRVFKDLKPRYVVMASLNFLFELIVDMGVFVLILAGFAKLRMGRYLSFGKIFKVSIYSLAPYIVCTILSYLFGIGFLKYIGFIVASIFNIITINELMKDLYLTRKEG